MPDIVVSAGRGRRGADRRRGAGVRLVAVVLSGAAVEAFLGDVERRVLVVRRAVERVDEGLRVAALRRVGLAARRVVEEARRFAVEARRVGPLATSRAFFVSPSMRFSALLTSARVLAFLTWDWSSLMAARAVLSASLTMRSARRRRSGGTWLSASRSARRPALTARPTRPPRRVERRDVRFLVAMHNLHQMRGGVRLTHRTRMGAA